jgi:hypothetical protein
MRTKLFGAFIAALAVAAFAVLPASAMAAPAVLKMEGEEVPATTTWEATSSNLSFTGRPSGPVIHCGENRVTGTVTENPGATVSLSSTNWSFTEGGSMFCPLPGTGGRLESRVSSFVPRSELHLTKAGGVATGSLRADFTFRVYDRARSPNPIAHCIYEGSFEVTGETGSDVFSVAGEGTRQASSEGECAETGDLEGTFRLARRSGAGTGGIVIG